MDFFLAEIGAAWRLSVSEMMEALTWWNPESVLAGIANEIGQAGDELADSDSGFSWKLGVPPEFGAEMRLPDL